MLCNAKFGSRGVAILITWGGGVRGATDRKISASEECRVIRCVERVEEGKLV